MGIFELLIISEPIQQLINNREPSQIIREQAIADGMITLRRDGINQILNGITTAKEVLQYTV